MSIEQNKLNARRYIEEIFNKGNLDALPEFMTPDVVDHGAPPSLPNGIEGQRKFVQMYRHAFPDLHLTVEDVIAEEDRMAIRWTAQGTQVNELLGVAPSGEARMWAGVTIAYLVDGKAKDLWGIEDLIGTIQRLGSLAPRSDETLKRIDASNRL